MHLVCCQYKSKRSSCDQIHSHRHWQDNNFLPGKSFNSIENFQEKLTPQQLDAYNNKNDKAEYNKWASTTTKAANFLCHRYSVIGHIKKK